MTPSVNFKITLPVFAPGWLSQSTWIPASSSALVRRRWFSQSTDATRAMGFSSCRVHRDAAGEQRESYDTGMKQRMEGIKAIHD
jgi:hypothetical protein